MMYNPENIEVPSGYYLLFLKLGSIKNVDIKVILNELATILTHCLDFFKNIGWLRERVFLFKFYPHLT
jgi:hypothetical protein